MSLAIEEVHKVFCDYYQIDLDYFFNKSRKRTFIDPRQQFHFLCKEYTKLSLADIGKYYKDITGVFYDHATIIHSGKAIKNYIDTDKTVFNDISNLRKLLDSKKSELKKTAINKENNLWYQMYATIGYFLYVENNPKTALCPQNQ